MIYYVTSSFVDMAAWCRNAIEGSAVPVWAGSGRNCCVISIQSMFQRSIVQRECDIKWLNLETGTPNLYQRSMSSSSMDDNSQRYQSAQLIPDRLITWTNRWVTPPSKSGLIGMLANHNLFTWPWQVYYQVHVRVRVLQLWSIEIANMRLSLWAQVIKP